MLKIGPTIHRSSLSPAAYLASIEQATTVFGRVIFDYGGVLSRHRRAEYLCQTLATNEREQRNLRRYLKSHRVKDCSIGQTRIETLVGDIRRRAPSRNNEAIYRALEAASEADEGAVEALARVSMRADVYIISNSLPPYTRTIRSELGGLCKAIFCSDEVGLRKPEGLAQYAAARVDNLFGKGAVYFDDDPANLMFPAACGAEVVLVQ